MVRMLLRPSFVVLLLWICTSCATRDGISSETTVSAATVPLAGGIYEGTVNAANEVGNLALNAANGAVNAPFNAAESALGIQRTGQQGSLPPAYRSTVPYSERLSRRRTARGLPVSPELRVRQRQNAARARYRRPASNRR